MNGILVLFPLSVTCRFHQKGPDGTPAPVGSHAIYLTTSALLKGRAARSIGSDVNTNAGINSGFLNFELWEMNNEVEYFSR